jgi:thiol:disulfide interchange protein DsbD
MIRAFLAAAFAAFALAAPATAADQVKTDNVAAELVSARSAVAPGETATLALRLDVREHWHTYWINPGDSGLPTTLAWSLPPGFAAGDIQWPAPKAIPYGPLTNYGYDGVTLYPVAITVPASAPIGSTVSLKAQADWLVCEEICIAEGGVVSIDLAVAATGEDDPFWKNEIDAAVAALPRPGAIEARLTKEGGGVALTLAGDALGGAAIRALHFFPLDGMAIDHAAAQAPEIAADGARLTLKAGVDATLGEKPLAGVLTLERQEAGDWRPVAYAIEAAPGAALAIGAVATAARTADGGGLTLPLALLFAFLGGLILNVMPCVLPVLSIKALSLARGAEEGTGARHGGLYFAGVMATFLALGAAVAGLTQAGAAAGWGFQLQEPLVVAGLALLFFLIGLNLLGFFEVGGGVQNVGAGLARRGGDAGAFFTGALAVVAATPCTAPFMAGAMGFAAAQPPAAALAVFAALGFGFALPMTALSATPALRRLIPKPGPWMERLKQGLAFPMFATAVWLVWILASLSGADGVLRLLAVAAAASAALWAWRAFEGVRGRVAVAGLAALAAGAVIWVSRPQPSALAAAPWSPARVAELRSAGQAVFVNFTADWCVTCKVNEQTSLASPKVAAAFARTGVVYLKADWTVRDAEIAQALAEHGRNGVPLYLVYTAGSEGAPTVLPQLLTEQTVIEAVVSAAGDAKPPV